MAFNMGFQQIWYWRVHGTGRLFFKNHWRATQHHYSKGPNLYSPCEYTTFRCVIDNMFPPMVYTADTDITKFSNIIPSLARGFKWWKIVGTKQVGLNFETQTWNWVKWKQLWLEPIWVNWWMFSSRDDDRYQTTANTRL